jgi:hypothetical protein
LSLEDSRRTGEVCPLAVRVTGRRGDVGEDVMSKVIPDISMSLDGLIAQPENGPGAIHRSFFS